MLRAVNQVKVPVCTSCIAIVINIILNYILIFGAFGAPRLGVVGAALATLIARLIETALVVGYVYGTKSPVAGTISELFGWPGPFIRRFLDTAAPVIANEFMWGLGTTMYSLAYGRMGDDAVAAITIATTIQDIVVVLFQGLSAATAVILRNEMGAGKLKRAERYAVNCSLSPPWRLPRWWWAYAGPSSGSTASRLRWPGPSTCASFCSLSTCRPRCLTT